MSGFFKSMSISASGLSAQRLRMNILSTNLANAQSTRTPEGEPYRRQDVVFEASELASPFEDFLSEDRQTQLKKVKVSGIHQDTRDFKRIYNPGHDDADKEGYVLMPNVDITTEMVNMITATRAYETHAMAFNEAKNMALKSIELGKV